MGNNDERMTYFIFRVFSNKESRDNNKKYVYYGWSRHKSVIKAFLSQRSSKKYKLVEFSEEDIENNARGFNSLLGSYDALDSNYEIDFIKLKSAKDNDIEIPLFSTASELHESEIKIQRHMASFCSLESMNIPKGREKEMLEMISNLDDYYGSALFYIGYRPGDFDILFDSADERDSYSRIGDVEWQIDEAYEGYNESPQEEKSRMTDPPGLANLDDVSTKIIYSIESFITVMKEDL